MCGIAGIYTKSAVNKVALVAATNAIRHRGPDGNGIFVDKTGRVGLGHVRLAIIDLSPTGAQPMTSGNGRYTLTYNGEIYNYREIRQDLLQRGCRFRGDADTEVLLEGFALLGPAILDKLNGIFALAILDNVTGALFIARDNMGIKPLYYVQTRDAVAFASELKALEQLVPLDTTLDVSAIRKYLTFLWCPGEQTPLKAVKKLEPGSAMLIRDGAIVRINRYWTAPAYQPRKGWKAQDCARELRALVDTCVERQTVSDAPIGAFLSGGLDSSAIVAAMRKNASRVQCYTIDTGETEQGATEDLPYAREAAAKLGVDLHVAKVSSDTLAHSVADMITMLDEPLADPACLNVLFISRLAREHGVKVLLSGAGGDDLFSGYRRHALMAMDPYWSALPGPVRQGLVALAYGRSQHSAFGRRMAKALGSLALDGDLRVTSSFVWGAMDAPGRLLSGDVRGQTSQEDTFAPFNAVLAQQPDAPALEKCLALERRFFLTDHNLTYTDKMGMATAVEIRVPLIDLDLVQFASQVPAELKCRNFMPKWVFKESQRGVLPDRIIDRPKTGFGAPLRNWMKSGMHELVDDLLSPETIKARGLFDMKEVAKLRLDDFNGVQDGSYTLFSIMCIEQWCRRFTDAPATEAQRSAMGYA